VGYRLGVDIGGTFTDLVLFDESSGEVFISKISSTPKNPAIGFIDGIKKINKQVPFAYEDIKYLVHGTTVATNSLLEYKTARTGLLTTAGFKDVLEIGRHFRKDLYNLFQTKPPILVTRDLRKEVTERVDADGNIIKAIDQEGVKQLLQELIDQGVDSIAVGYLHAYVNPLHENITVNMIRDLYPEIYSCASSEIVPEYREYERISTTVVNAAVMPIVDKYLDELEKRLQELGINTRLYVMQSNGGMVTAEIVRRRPVNIIESGPAAGVIASAYIGKQVGEDKIISFDIGGTTAKLGLIEGGNIKMKTEYEVGGVTHGGRGEGYPIKIPVIDLVEIGAGGGSIAWLDEGGALRVGPHSAGADPGPVCYGIGGTEVTNTDCHVVLGRINPNYFLGGEMSLDIEGARKALEDKLAKPLNMSVEKVASGVIEIKNANMLKALRAVSIEKGYDPREFTLVTFGGAGSLHAADMATLAGISKVIIPPSQGVASALGLLVADIRHDFVQSYMSDFRLLDLDKLNNIFLNLEKKALTVLRQDGNGNNDYILRRSADIRYVGQAYEVNVDVPSGSIDKKLALQLEDQFHKEHMRLFAHAAESDPIELVNLRTTIFSIVQKPAVKKLTAGNADPANAYKGTRKVYFTDSGFIDCPTYERSLLQYENRISGPAIIEQMDSTVVVTSNFTVNVDQYGNLVMARCN
jgi:N-methylhydantoinase A